MNSIAIWSDNNKNFNFHLDLNLWITKEKNNNYIEFGIKLFDLSINNLFIYLPFKFDNIEDKTKELQEPKLLNAMFNESLSSNDLNNSSFTEIKKNNDTLFYFCKLSKSDYSIDDVDDEKGKVLKIKINKSNNDINVIYYRFRIGKLDNIFEEVTTNWFFTNEIKEQINFIEISINSVRKLPSYIVDKIGDIEIKSMNLFVMTESFINLLFKSKNIEKSRVLESIWKNYVKSQNVQKIIAYHWKKDNFRDYNLFIKTSYINKSKRLIFGMIVAMLIVGGIGGILGNIGTDLIKNKIICKKDRNATISKPKDTK